MKRIIIGSAISIISIFLVGAYAFFNYFEITQAQIRRLDLVITTASEEKIYDGTPLSNDYWYISSGSLLDEDTIYGIMETVITNAGVAENIVGITILDANNYNVTKNYNIVYDIGNLTILPRPLGIHTPGEEKVYDGITLSHKTWDIYEGSLVDKHRLMVVMNKSLTIPGSIENDASITVFNDKDVDVTSNYAISKDFGMLSISKRPITIETSGSLKIYDGHPLYNSEWHLIEGTLVLPHQLDIRNTSSITQVGVVDNIPAVNLFDGLNNPVTSYYDIKIISGVLEITPRPLTIRTSSDYKFYDGLPLFGTGHEITDGTLASNQKLEVQNISSITRPGTIFNEAHVNLYDNNFQSVINNYHITYDLGTLTILGRLITIETETKTKFYDGLPLYAEDYRMVEGNMLEGHTLQVQNIQPITDVSWVLNEVFVTITDQHGQDITQYYNVNQMYGYLEVLARRITIKTLSDSKSYDGTSLSLHEYVISSGTILQDHFINDTMTSYITEPGTISNDIGIEITNFNREIKTYNYQISYDLGSLVINKRQITIETESKSKVYDGTALNAEGYRIINGSLILGHTLDVVNIYSITDVNLVTNEVFVTIFNENGSDITRFYEVIQQFGYLEVTPRPITITTASDEKMYDGTPLSIFEYSLTSGSMLSNHELKTTMQTTITNPGSTHNSIGVEIIDEFNQLQTKNYNITLDLGTLVVSLRKITIATDSITKVYDGMTLYGDGYRTVEGGIVNSHIPRVIHTSSITDVGFVLNEAFMSITDVFGNDVTRYYQITKQFGNLVVTPRPITLTTKSDEKMYDGTPLMNPLWQVIQGSVLASQNMSVTMNSYQTIPGVTENKAHIEIFDTNGNNQTSNYKITVESGTLKVTLRKITIETASEAKVYDGTALSNENIYIISGSLLSNHELLGILESSRIDVGISLNPANISIRDEQSHDITHYYAYELITGKLEVTPRLITITTGSDEKMYDGTPLTNPSSQVIQGSVLASQNMSVTMNSYQTIPGVSENKAHIEIFDTNGNNQTSNYKITLNRGNLTVTPRKITIETWSETKVYDGTALSNENIHITSGSLLSNHELLGIMESSITDVGVTFNTAIVTISDEESHDITHYYAYELITGKLEVTPRPITVTTASDEKMYDGTPLTNPSWQLEQGSIIDDHDFNVNMNTSRILPGVTENNAYIEILDTNGKNKTSNYKITLNRGNLTVTPRKITIETGSETKVYDGTALSDEEIYVTSGSLLINHQLSGILESSRTDVGVSLNSSIVTISDEENQDITHYYTFEVIKGTLEVTPLPITVTTESAEKDYDGTPLMNPDWQLVHGSIMDNHRFNVVMNTSRTLPGTVDNVAILEIFDDFDKNVTNNYEIKFELGTLQIYEIPMTLRSSSKVKVYDGTPLSFNEWTLVNGDLLAGHVMVVDIEGEITDVGKIDNLIFVNIYDENNQDVTRYYHFNLQLGELTVLVNIYGGDELATEMLEFEDIVELQVLSTHKETMYLRDKSWGAYNLRSWHPGSVHQTNTFVSPLSFTSIALNASGYDSSALSVKYVRDQIPYLTPYYIDDTLTTQSDIQVLKKPNEVENYNYISFDYTKNGSSLQTGSLLSLNELEYRTHVYNTYLALPEKTQLGMIELALENDLNPESQDIIREIQLYIQNAATYNLDFQKIPDNVEDIGLYFLTVLKEGICQHFATAATLMYRALGIPARYVTGYVAYTEANAWVDVMTSQGHAWVEVYMDGIGWIPLEVTASDNGPGGGEEPGGEEPGGEEPGGDNSNSIVVSPIHVIEPYMTGITISPTQVKLTNFDDLRAQGYTYTFELEGTLSQAGTIASKVKQFTLYDSQGHDVTDEFDIKYKDGKLQLYVYEIDLYTSGASKVYDGLPLIDHAYHIDGALGAGHYIKEVKYLNSLETIGSRLNQAVLVIYDAFDNDVTGQYLIHSNYGTLSVTPIKITLVSASAIKKFDGTALTNHTVNVLNGYLLDGHEIVSTITGSQTSIGRSDNTILDIKIMYNQIDVTNNYEIEILLGTLTVRP